MGRVLGPRLSDSRLPRVSDTNPARLRTWHDTLESRANSNTVHEHSFTNTVHDVFTNSIANMFTNSRSRTVHEQPFTNIVHEPFTNIPSQTSFHEHRSRTAHEPFTNHPRTVLLLINDSFEVSKSPCGHVAAQKCYFRFKKVPAGTLLLRNVIFQV